MKRTYTYIMYPTAVHVILQVSEDLSDRSDTFYYMSLCKDRYVPIYSDGNQTHLITYSDKCRKNNIRKI